MKNRISFRISKQPEVFPRRPAEVIYYDMRISYEQNDRSMHSGSFIWLFGLFVSKDIGGKNCAGEFRVVRFIYGLNCNHISGTEHRTRPLVSFKFIWSRTLFMSCWKTWSINFDRDIIFLVKVRIIIVLHLLSLNDIPRT